MSADEYREKYISTVGCKPVVDNYNKLIRMYGYEKRIDDMEECYKELRMLFIPNLRTFSSLLYGYSQLGLIKKAIGVVNEIKRYNYKLDTSMYFIII